MIDVNGEKIEKAEALALIRMLCNDAKQIAGVFHGMNRSEKFRLNWPDEYKFADANWKTFMEAARQMYAERLGDPNTSPAQARKMHIALVLQAQISKGQETDNRLQLAPNTLQFEGDKIENRKIIDQFGMKPNLRALVKNSVASRQ
jgi:hypothetical protein